MIAEIIKMSISLTELSLKLHLSKGFRTTLCGSFTQIKPFYKIYSKFLWRFSLRLRILDADRNYQYGENSIFPLTMYFLVFYYIADLML